MKCTIQKTKVNKLKLKIEDLDNIMSEIAETYPLENGKLF